jgi:hypothetical protein
LQGIAVRRSGIRSAELRGVLAGIAVIDLLSFYVFIGQARERALESGTPIGSFLAGFSQPPVRALVIVIGIAGAVAFARSAGRLVAGLFPLVALMLLSTVHAHLFGSPWRHMYYSGLCLSGWLIGLVASRVGGNPSDESYARIGSLALVGAAYLNAGISKLAFGGLEWASGVPIQAVIVAQDGLVRDGLLSTYRSWAVMSPAVAASFSLATMIFELAGPLMLLGGPLRPIVALGLLGMHLNIYVLTDILYWQSMVFLIVLGILPYQEAPEPRPAPLPILASRRGFIGSVIALSAVGLLAIGHQHHRYNAWATGRAPNPPPERVAEPAPVDLVEPPPVHPAEPPPPQRIGPFSLGEQVTDEWSIEALTRTDGGFTVTLHGPAGRARFEVTCTGEGRSPFDVGSAHILYFRDVPLPVAERIGNALRDRVRTATAPHDPCEVVNAWLREFP